MISFNYFNLFMGYFILYMTLFNGINSENLITSYKWFKNFNCDNNIKMNNKIVLDFNTNLTINCKFVFNSECFNRLTQLSNKSINNCDQISADLRHLNDLEPERLKFKNFSQFDNNNNNFVINLVLNISNVGKKHNAEYSLVFKVKPANESKFDYYLGINFTLEINDLGDRDDKCLFSDQCVSNICRNSRCICGKSAPISQDKDCLTERKLLESCYVTEQCQYGGHHWLTCKDINGEKLCQCLPQYILVESPQPKCLIPKQYNESCELSEECQEYDGYSFCSSHNRCKCVAKFTVDKNNKCTKTEIGNRFPFAIVFGSIGGLIVIVIISALSYKYYFVKRFEFKRRSNSQTNATQLQMLSEKSQNRYEPQVVTHNKFSEDDSVTNDNIYDDIAEIRYVRNQTYLHKHQN